MKARFPKFDFSNLRVSNGGGMAVQRAVAENWLTLTHCPIVEGYGLTETSSGATCNEIMNTNYSGDVGMPMPSTEVSIRNDAGIEVEFGEPGESPREGQAYFIVIHIRVDPRRKTYLIGDLVGSVVGTDGFTQRVPDEMFILDDEGLPQPIKRSKPIKVTDGVVQVLMRVKGAYSGVRDNIYLKSKMLREEQNLQLIFQDAKTKDQD